MRYRERKYQEEAQAAVADHMLQSFWNQLPSLLGELFRNIILELLGF